VAHYRSNRPRPIFRFAHLRYRFAKAVAHYDVACRDVPHSDARPCDESNYGFGFWRFHARSREFFVVSACDVRRHWPRIATSALTKKALRLSKEADR